MLQYRQASKLLGTYAKKMMPGQRIHGKFNYLMNSGRTSCGGGFNLQNLPKEEPPKKEKQAPMHDQEVEETPEEQIEKKPKNTIRGCFVPPPGNVFVVVDYKTLELTVLGWAWKHQLKFGDSLHTIIQNDGDMHRLIAAKVLDKEPEDVTKDERNATKPVSLGRPGGLGWRTIQKQVKDEFGFEFTEAQVRERMQAYEDLCPELTEHLKSRIDTGLELAIALGLTPAAYNAAAFEAKNMAELMKALGASAPTESKDVTITGPDIAENGAVVPVGASTTLAGVKQLLLLVEKNPSALIASFNVSDSVDANITTRAKMGQSSDVYAVALLADGRVLFAKKEIKVTLGGCGG